MKISTGINCLSWAATHVSVSIWNFRIANNRYNKTKFQLCLFSWKMLAWFVPITDYMRVTIRSDWSKPIFVFGVLDVIDVVFFFNICVCSVVSESSCSLNLLLWGTYYILSNNTTMKINKTETVAITSWKITTYDHLKIIDFTVTIISEISYDHLVNKLRSSYTVTYSTAVFSKIGNNTTLIE